MYNGIGLQTPRGSGTNGYIQTNKFFIRPKTGKVAHNTGGFEGDQGTAGITKKPNKEILEHDRKRQILLKLTVLEDKLIEQGYTDEEIEEKLQEARKTLEAADASETSGGPTAIVVSDAKVSDTQSHQIAARKEKQMETLRAALGIRASDSNEEIIEGSDDGPRNGRKIDPSQKREHAFLDREFSRKKHVVEDLEEEKDDQKRGDKALKNKKEKYDADDSRLMRKEESRRRRRQADSSDTDSSEKPAKESRKKHRKGRLRSDDETDSDSNHGRKNISSKKHKKSRRHDSESDDSATDDETDAGRGKKRSGTIAKRKQSRSSSDSDDSTTDDNAGKVSLHQEVEKYKKSRKRHDSDDDDDFDVRDRWESGKKRSVAIAKRNQSRRSGDSDDSATDDDVGKVILNQEVQKYEKSRKRLDSDDDDDFDVRGRWESGGVHEKGCRNSEGDGDSDLDKAGKHKKEVESRSQKRNDAKGNNSDAGIEELEKSRSRRHDAHEEDSYMRGGSNSSRKTLGMGTVERELDSLNDDSYDSGSSDSDSSASDYMCGKHTKKNPMDKIRSGGGDRRQAIEKKLDTRDDDSEGSSRSSYSGSSDSDYGHGRTITKGPTDKNRTGAGSGFHNKGGQSGSEYNREEKGFSCADVGHDDGTKELYKSGRETVDKTNRDIQEIGSSKRKLDAAIKDEERQFKSRNKTAGKETKHDDDRQGELKFESELKNRAYSNRDNIRRDDYSKLDRARGHGDENVERRSREYREHVKEKMANRDDKDHKGRSYQGQEEGDEFRRHRKYDGDQLYGSRNDRENKEHAGDERHSRDAEDHRGRRYQGNEEHNDEIRRHGKDDGDQRYGSRRRGREDEERANRGHERDRRVDHSKRARYDDSYSGERKRYENDKRDGDRARYKD